MRSCTGCWAFSGQFNSNVGMMDGLMAYLVDYGDCGVTGGPGEINKDVARSRLIDNSRFTS